MEGLADGAPGLDVGAAVGAQDGNGVGAPTAYVGTSVGEQVGEVGEVVGGRVVGTSVGEQVGDVGKAVGSRVVGTTVGTTDGAGVGIFVGAKGTTENDPGYAVMAKVPEQLEEPAHPSRRTYTWQGEVVEKVNCEHPPQPCATGPLSLEASIEVPLKS